MLWTLKDPQGRLIVELTGSNITLVWGYGFDFVSRIEGDEWRNKYWKKWDASIRDAKKRGWRFVKVKIVEVPAHLNPLGKERKSNGKS